MNQDDEGGGGGGGGMSGMGGGMSGLRAEEMAIVHFLLDNRSFIDRSKAMVIKDGQVEGMELLTTSDREPVATKIQEHVRQMKALVGTSDRWVRQGDPLYRELLSRRGEITMDVEYRTDGVLVTEKGKTECAVALIQGHSEAVDGFIDKGRAEVHANHPVPSVCLD